MTPKLPDLLIADLLVDPSRNVLTRERAGDSVTFSNVLDAAKGVAGKDDTSIQADQRQSDQFAASLKADTRARARAQSEEALTAQRSADADFAAQQSLQRRDDARAQANAQAEARADARLQARDDSRAAAKSAERADSSGDTALGAKDDSPVGQTDEQGDGSDSGQRSDSATSASAARPDDGSAATNPVERSEADRTSAVAADSANVAVAMASALASASGVSQGLAPGAGANGGATGPAAVGAIGATSGVASAAALAALAGSGGASAWGAMSNAQAGSSAEGVDQMARQLGLLRSIQSAGAAADSAKLAAQAAAAQQQAGATVDAAASAEAIADAAAVAGAQTSATTAGSTEPTASAVPVAGVGPGLAGAQSPTGATAKSAASGATGGADAGVASALGAGSGSSLVDALGAGAVANAGLISAEFVPEASSDGEALSAAQSTAGAKGANGSQLTDSVTADPDVVQGFAQVARAFDQADAIAQARIARVAAQNKSLAAANGGSSVAEVSYATGAPGSASPVVLKSDASVAFAQAVQVAQSSGVIAAAGLSSGSVLSGLGASTEGKGAVADLSLASALGALEDGAAFGVAAGSGTGGLTGGGAGDGGAGSGGRFSPAESGSRVQTAGGALASRQSAVGSTFNSALSAVGGVTGSNGASATEAELSSVGAASATVAGAVGSASGESALSGLPGSGVTSAITPQAIGGSLRVESSGSVTAQTPVTTDQLPVVLDQTAIDLARLRGGMLTLELAPADLGRLSFEMRIDDSGAAFVAIRLADDTVRALVENAAGALRDSLSREGFKLDSFTVSSGFGSPEQRENSQNQAFAETSNRRVQSSDSSVGSGNSVQSRVSNTQVRPGTSSLSLFA